MTGEERNEGSSAKEGLATQARSSAAHTVRSLCTELSTCAEDHQQHGGGAWGILTSPTVNSRLPWTHTRMQVQALQQQQLGNPARSAAQRRPPRALALAHGPVAAEQLNLSKVLCCTAETKTAPLQGQRLLVDLRLMAQEAEGAAGKRGLPQRTLSLLACANVYHCCRTAHV